MPSIASIKAAVRLRDGFCCTRCGLTNAEHRALYRRQLQVHRVTPGSLYSEAPGVCVTLCVKCHGPQPRRQPGQPDLAGGERNTVPLNSIVPRRITASLRQYLASTKPRVTKTAAVEQALEAFLAEKGFPVAADDEDE